MYLYYIISKIFIVNICILLQGAQGEKTVKLKEGEINNFKVEVTAEDGTIKFYHVNITRMSSSTAVLKVLKISNSKLHPQFESSNFEYSGKVYCF